MFRNFVVVAVLLPLFACAASNVNAQSYVIHELGPSDSTYATARGISDTGLIAGCYYEPSHLTQPVIWRLDGTPTLLSSGPTYGAVARDVNNSGQAVGTYDGNPVIWQTDGQLVHLPEPDTVWGSVPCAISDTGWIAGTAKVGTTGRSAAVVWSPELSPTVYGTGPHESYSISDIDDSGVGVGSSTYGYAGPAATVYHVGVSLICGGFGGPIALAYGISDSGYICGLISSLPVVWDPYRNIISLEGYGTPYAVNDQGLAVGQYSGGAVVWNINGGRAALPMLTDGSTSIAYNINNAGWIVGECKDTGGRTHAVLWEPVPEPPAAVCVLSLLATAAAFVRRKAHPTTPS